jgi:hypothetical protein
LSESDTHRRLKELTLLWAYRRGYRCCAMEVRAPRSSYRVDVAGIRIDRKPTVSTVVVFECKQSPNDLLRDNRRHDELRERLIQLQDRREKLESLLAVHHPSLRTSDCLFPEWTNFDFTTLDHQGYRQTIEKIGRVQRQLFQNIKFDLVTRYRLGNLHYLVAPVGMVDPAEIPIGWGFLEVGSDDVISQKTLPTRFNQIGATDWLERIGKASTAQAIRSMLAGEHSSKFLPKS